MTDGYVVVDVTAEAQAKVPRPELVSALVLAYAFRMGIKTHYWLYLIDLRRLTPDLQSHEAGVTHEITIFTGENQDYPEIGMRFDARDERQAKHLANILARGTASGVLRLDLEEGLRKRVWQAVAEAALRTAPQHQDGTADIAGN